MDMYTSPDIRVMRNNRFYLCTFLMYCSIFNVASYVLYV